MRHVPASSLRRAHCAVPSDQTDEGHHQEEHIQSREHERTGQEGNRARSPRCSPDRSTATTTPPSSSKARPSRQRRQPRSRHPSRCRELDGHLRSITFPPHQAVPSPTNSTTGSLTSSYSPGPRRRAAVATASPTLVLSSRANRFRSSWSHGRSGHSSQDPLGYTELVSFPRRATVIALPPGAS